NFATTPARNPTMMVQMMLILQLPLCVMKSGVTRRQTTVRRIFIDGRWQFPRQSRKKLFLRQSGLLHQCGQDILSDGLLELRRRYLLVGTGADPRFGSVSLSVLGKLLEQFAKATAKQASDPSFAQHAAKDI